MFRSKPTEGSVCKGICRALPLPQVTQLRVEISWRSLLLNIYQMQEDRNMLLLPSDAVLRSSLVAFPYYLNHTNTRRARHVPEQTYRRISSGRNMSCSSPPPSDAVTRRNNVTFFIG